MPDHRDRSATDLAHGKTNSDDIARVRQDLESAEETVIRNDETSVVRRQEVVRRRKAKRADDAGGPAPIPPDDAG